MWTMGESGAMMSELLRMDLDWEYAQKYTALNQKILQIKPFDFLYDTSYTNSYITCHTMTK